MTHYPLNTTLGTREAFWVLIPKPVIADFFACLGEQGGSDSNPRLLNPTMAVICDRPLSELVKRRVWAVGPKAATNDEGAISHFETSIKAFTTAIGQNRLGGLSTLEPVEDFTTCLPSYVQMHDTF